jgi:YidC/Oxa1 family membrane protein insertase
MTSLLGVPVDAAYHLVAVLTSALTPALGGLAAVAGIVIFTVAVRLLVLPLSLRAMRGQAIQARLVPQVSKLRAKYGKQPERFQQELTALYKREGTSLFAGLSPLLLQWPFLSVVYLLFRSPVIDGRTNTLLTHDLLGVPLGRYWAGGAGPASTQGLVFLGVFALLAAACWLSARLARAISQAPAGRPLTRLLPYISVVIAAFAPLAGAIYLVTSTAWSVAERRLFWRPDRPQHRTAQRAARRSLPDGPVNRVSPGR